MTQSLIIDACPWHVGQIVRRLRFEHAIASRAVDPRLHHTLVIKYRESYYRRALLIDGELSMLWGLTGTPISPFGFVWMAMTEKATFYPMRVARTFYREVERMATNKHQLESTILGGDEAAMRFSAFLGFRCEGFVGAMGGGRKRLSKYMVDTPDIRIPAGHGYVVPVAYSGVA
jgi:hypothetical protein